MKKKTLMMFTMLCMVASFNSCKKDNKQPDNLIQKSYFTIDNATFVNSGFPTSSPSGAPVISSVFGNGSVLEGGSNPISISTSSTIKEVLVGVQGKNGYYKVPSSALKSTIQTYLAVLLFSSNFETDNFTILIAIVDNSGLISEQQTIDVSRIVAGTGKLQVSVSWDKANDLDLHLIEPNLEQIYWSEKTSTHGGNLDVDSNPICHLDYINNENITYSGDAIVEKGKYIVKISLFESCQIKDITKYVVTARLDGNIITPTVGKNPYYGTVAYTHSEIDGDGPDDGDAVMEFNIATTKSVSIGNKKMLKFSYSNMVNLEKQSIKRVKKN